MSKFPQLQVQYFHKETKDKCSREIKELLDLNFGKDWRLFLSLYYSDKLGRHALQYNNPTPVESERFKNRKFAGVVRSLYFGLSCKIIQKYFDTGITEATKYIETNDARFEWFFDKSGQKQTIISDELYNKHHGITEVPKKQEEQPKKSIEERMIEICSKQSSIGEKIQQLEEEVEKETDKEKENDLFKQIKLLRDEYRILQSKYNRLSLQQGIKASDSNAKIKNRYSERN